MRGHRSAIIWIAIGLLAACGTSSQDRRPMASAQMTATKARVVVDQVELLVPLGLTWPTFPKDDPPTVAEVAAGRSLFFEPKLSRDGAVSCATCHDPAKGFADARPLAVGVAGSVGRRNSPTILNAAFFEQQGWGGEHTTIEDQSLSALIDDSEMGLRVEEIVPAVRGTHCEVLERIYGVCSPDTVALALGAFQRTVIAGDAPFDRYIYEGDQQAISEDAKHGFDVFVGKGRCIRCHFMRSTRSHPFGGRHGLYTDGRYHNLGVGLAAPIDELKADLGRFEVTKEAGDWGAFKTPILRNVSITAPYMHDGSLATLRDVVEHYDKGGIANPNLDPDIVPLGLTDVEKQQLIAFLESLTSTRLPDYL